MLISDSEKKYKRLREYMDLFEEANASLLDKWDKYMALSQHAKNDLRDKWSKYYKDVRNTSAYKNYTEVAAAFKAGNMAKVKELANKAKGIKVELDKPSSIDPDSMYRRLENYLRVKDALEGNTKESISEEAKKIFNK